MVDIKIQDKLLLITYYVPEVLTFNPSMEQILCPYHVPGTGLGTEPCTKQSLICLGAYM